MKIDIEGILASLTEAERVFAEADAAARDESMSEYIAGAFREGLAAAVKELGLSVVSIPTFH